MELLLSGLFKLGLSSILLIFHVARLKSYACGTFYPGRRPTKIGIFLCWSTCFARKPRKVLSGCSLPVTCAPLYFLEKVLSREG